MIYSHQTGPLYLLDIKSTPRSLRLITRDSWSSWSMCVCVCECVSECVTSDPQTAGKCVWQISKVKKPFWILQACLVYLLCLWVALSSVFLSNWILCTHSHRKICISSHTRHIYLPHTCTAFAFMCLLPLCIITARASPSHVFAFFPSTHIKSKASLETSKGVRDGKHVLPSK